jgi:hypothetical protein
VTKGKSERCLTPGFDVFIRESLFVAQSLAVGASVDRPELPPWPTMN